MALRSSAISEGMWWRVLLIAAIASVSGRLRCSAFDFDVGGDRGWAVPPKQHRPLQPLGLQEPFQDRRQPHAVFRYKKDSVMVVTEEEYGRCNSEQPIVFYNNGETEMTLDHAGTYYFISGLREHCQKGQKMILKVLGHTAEEQSPTSSPPGNHTAAAAAPPPPSAADSSGAAASSTVGLLAILAASASCCLL
ncbi:unnamed protein product [Spirodela intermedia]|uniref:Phytocyanin domain-containing protein n=1 Tax=Spirodela intermedia TaxID=51605 RepID=A0A7I8JDK2_SPIIN|nr:unnamed protein product [Spirodela intermedia]CAA6668254.1 unnamed protein product [Spirodela intermedia]